MNANTPISLRGLFAAALGATKAPSAPMTQRTGRHGEKVGLLGYGAMRLPTVDGGHANPWGEYCSKAAIDQKKLDGQIDYMLAHGVNYFDTAPCYCRGESEGALGAALARHPRSSYYIATKLSNFAPSQFSAEASKKLFEDSLRFLKTDYIDFYLLHSIGNGDFATFRKRFVDNGMIPWLFEQKRKGRIRNIGWSFHGDYKTVEWLLEKHDKGEYVWDFAQIQLNYVDWRRAKKINDRNVNAEPLYRELARRSIPVVVMEPLLGGRLARHNEALEKVLTPLDPGAPLVSWGLRFAANPPGVLTVLSGMTFQEHIEENCRILSPFKPLTPSELVSLDIAAEAYLGCGAIPCTRCQYCMPCPYGLDIPGLLAFANDIRADGVTNPDEIRRRYAKAIPDPRRRADRCIGCGVCRKHCPQQIDIPFTLDGIAAFLDGL